MEIEHLKTSGLQDKALYDYTFARDNGINPEIKLAHNYVSNWEEMKANASGLLIWGDVGTGKSFFAGCIANALLEKGIPVLMTNFSRILNTLTGMHFEDRNQFINSLNRYSLLIIDCLLYTSYFIISKYIFCVFFTINTQKRKGNRSYCFLSVFYYNIFF